MSIKPTCTTYTGNNHVQWTPEKRRCGSMDKVNQLWLCNMGLNMNEIIEIHNRNCVFVNRKASVCCLRISCSQVEHNNNLRRYRTDTETKMLPDRLVPASSMGKKYCKSQGCTFHGNHCREIGHNKNDSAKIGCQKPDNDFRIIHRKSTALKI